jgi:hypothetical protein
MKLWLSILVALLATASAVCAGTNSFPFQVGERLNYRIYWGPVPAGNASLEVAGIETVAGHECYHLRAKALTSGVVDWLFHVDSTTESWLDAKEFFTRRYRQNRIEGKHTRRSETFYDHDRGQYTITNLVSGTRKVFPLDKKPIQDIVSSFYYLRIKPLQLKQPENFFVNAGDTTRLIRVEPDQRKTIWTNPLGNLPALRVEPNPTLTFVAANKGRMWLWFSDNAQRIPLILVSEMKIGSARFQLTEIKTTKTAATANLRLASKD